MRTEEEILQDFKKLGYEKQYCEETACWFYKRFGHQQLKHIFIGREFSKSVSCVMIDKEKNEFGFLDIEEFKLLHELFELWGWL